MLVGNIFQVLIVFNYLRLQNVKLLVHGFDRFLVFIVNSFGAFDGFDFLSIILWMLLLIFVFVLILLMSMFVGLLVLEVLFIHSDAVDGFDR